MNILILDTTKQKMQVFLNKDGVLFCGREVNSPKHLEHLLPVVDELLTLNKLQVSEIDVVAVSVGPGSFTGIRVGVSTAKAMASVFSKIKLVAVNSLELIAYTTMESKKSFDCLVTLIKSTQSQFYYAKYDKSLNEVESGVFTNQQVSELGGQKILVVTDSFEDVTGSLPNAIEIALKEKNYVDYVNKKIQKKQFTSLSKLSPIYLCLSQAENELLKKEQLRDKSN